MIMRLTFFFIQYSKRLQKLMFSTLYHSQTSFPFILKCPVGHKEDFITEFDLSTKLLSHSFSILIEHIVKNYRTSFTSF